MKIVFVLESINLLKNGTTATCLRFATELQKKGHEVLLLGHGMPEGVTPVAPVYPLPFYKFPIFEPLIEKEGFNFVKCDCAKIYDAIKDADVVHLFLPFKLENVTRIIADNLGIPVTCAFHLQPQNITSAIHLGHFRLLNNILYKSFKTYLYNQCAQVHCPSKMIAEQLKIHHYDRNITHTISNGIIPFFHRVKANKPDEFADKFVVTMSGRLASEKRQDLIIKAIASSKYNDRIQIVLCGQGPNKRRYIHMAKRWKLANPLQIKFCTQEELREVVSYTDLYVHASDFEIEGISAIEAIACGAVPIISDSKESATGAFALDDRCLFRHGSYRSLREKIEHFYENQSELKPLSEAYIESSKAYALDLQVDALEAMLCQAIEDKKQGKDLPTACPRKKDIRKGRKYFKRIIKAGAIDEMPERLR